VDRARRCAPASRQAVAVPAVIACLAIGTFLLYLPTGFHSFVDYDDQDYIFDNPHVVSGLSLKNILWAFQTGYAANWHPLTWISHMVDCQVFGVVPGPQHIVNALLHAANAAILCSALWRMTACFWRSAFVAALFAFHPVHVESVAWIAERKDVLSTFFWLLAILAYQFYASGRSLGRYLMVALLFSLGLMAKPMVVTLPAVLMLLDYWPLGRLKALRDLGPLLLEKLPLVGLSALSSAITFVVQRNGGAMSTLKGSPLLPRIGDALLAIYFYLGKMLWPHDLMLPYVGGGPAPDAGLLALAGAGFLGFTVAALLIGGRARYLPVGWFWYLGTLLPVIGLVRVGIQSAADRYTYIPSIGFFILVAWGGADLCGHFRVSRPVIAVAAAAILCACAALAERQIGYWKNGETLFLHSVRVDPDNLEAVNCLAVTYATDPDPAVRNPDRAVRLAAVCVEASSRKDPYFLDTLSTAYAAAHQFQLAIETDNEALRIPGNVEAEIAYIQGHIRRYKEGKAIHAD
jgi:hypothetical protein